MSEATKAEKPVYKRKTAPLAPIEFDVAMPEGTPHFKAKNLLLREFNSLGDYAAGEVSEKRDPTGKNRLLERIIKLEQVVLEITNVDPADLEATGGDPGQILRLTGNDDLAWVAWDAYVEALIGDRSKSRDVAVGRGDGEGGETASAGSAAAASVPGV